MADPVTSMTLSLTGALRRLSAGRDPAAWDELLQQTGPRMLALSRQILRDEALAEDAVQETLLQIRDYAPRLLEQAESSVSRGEDIAMRLIMRITCNTALRMLRSRKRSDRREDIYAQRAAGRHAPADVETLASLQEQLDRLPEEQRLPLVMHYLGGLDYEELSGQLGCPAATARTRAHRGLKSLREHMAMGALLLPGAGVEGLLQQWSSSCARPEAGTISGWRALLNSPRVSASPPDRGFTQGGYSLMAKSMLVSSAAVLAFSCTLLFMPRAHTAEGADAVVAPAAGMNAKVDKIPAEAHEKTGAAAPTPAPAPAQNQASPEEPDIKDAWKTADGRHVWVNKNKTVTVSRQVDATHITVEKYDNLLPKDARGLGWALDKQNWAPVPFQADLTEMSGQSWRHIVADKEYNYKIRMYWDREAEKAVPVVWFEESNVVHPQDELEKGDFDRPVTLEFFQTPFEDVVASLKTLCNRPIIMSEEAQKKAKDRIDLRFTDLPIRKVLELASELAGLGVTFENNAATIGLKQAEADDTEESNGSEATIKALTRRITFEFIETPAQEALNFINQLTRVNIILLPDSRDMMQTPVTLRVSDIEMRTALKWILRLAKLRYTIRDDVIRIHADTGAEDLAKARAVLARTPIDVAATPTAALALGNLKNEELNLKIGPGVVDVLGDTRCDKTNADALLKDLAEGGLVTVQADPKNTVRIQKRVAGDSETALVTKFDKKIAVDFAQIPLEDALGFFRQSTQSIIILSPDIAEVKTKSVTLQQRDMSVRESLSRILQQAGLKAVYLDEAVYIDRPENLPYMQDFLKVQPPAPSPAPTPPQKAPEF